MKGPHHLEIAAYALSSTNEDTVDAQLINTFLESVRTLFDAMLNTPVCFEPAKPRDRSEKCDVSGIIGLSGDLIGSVVLSLPMQSATEMVLRFAHARLDVHGEDFADAIGELANMVAGGAKARFTDRNVTISCPSVVVAPGHHVETPIGTAAISIPCTSPIGVFSILIAIQESAGAARASAPTAA